MPESSSKVLILRLALKNRLSRVNCLRMHLAGNVERSLLLDLARLQCDVCNVETWIFRDLNEFKLRAVESSSDSPKRTRQSSLGRLFLRSPQALSGAGTLYAHEVPARLADHGVENRRKDRLHKRPIVPDSRLQRIQAIRQDAPLAEKNGM
ncbi:MAG: hypothetical protein WBE76_23680 [Terracidiphilus sp.]